MKTVLCLAGARLALALSMPACGSDDDSVFKDGAGSIGGGDGGPGSSGGTGIGSSGTSGGGGPGGLDGDGACAAKNADGTRAPAYLFFILDQSLSMASSKEEKAKRWTPITQALTAFIKDPASEGIQAGLELFPAVSGDAACLKDSYASSEEKMDVRMTTLGAGAVTKFSSVWPETPTITKTPTKAVIQAMGPIADDWAKKHTDGKTAIVLLTDGYPQGCPSTPDDIDEVATEIKKYSNTVPVYVIGVSDKKDNLKDLQKLADAGKTKLTLVDTSDPAKTQKAFLDRINEIRSTTLSCDVTLPPAPDGMELDLMKINVTFTLADGTKQPLTYDENCTDGTGRSWHFDSVTAPTKISLCAMTCDVYERQPTSKVTVEFGCQRHDVVK